MKRLFSSSSSAKPLRKRHLSVEISAETASQFIRAEKFEKSEQGGSRECNLRYAAAAIQGFRPHMQDDYACSPDISLKGQPFAYFGVFDGHGEQGGIVSQYCSDNFLGALLDRKAIQTAKHVTEEILVAGIEKTFIKFDRQLEETQRKDDTTDLSYSGTTATLAMISPDQIFIGNVGDSRTILCRGNDVAFASKDHTPAVQSEEDRVTAAGGKVHTTPSKHKIILDAAAYSNLAVSRTLGDYGFKVPHTLPVDKRVVVPAGDVSVFERDHKRDQFMVLASDGIFKSLSDEEVVGFVLRQMETTEDLSAICRNLIHTAYYAADNIPDDTTVILIAFPAAPTLSQSTIEQEAKIEVEAKDAIESEIKEIVEKAESVWVVENEFNVLQRLVKSLPRKFRVQQRVPYVMDTLKRLREERFGSPSSAHSEPAIAEEAGLEDSNVFQQSEQTKEKVDETSKKSHTSSVAENQAESTGVNGDKTKAQTESVRHGVSSDQIASNDVSGEQTESSSDQAVSTLVNGETSKQQEQCKEVESDGTTKQTPQQDVS